MWRDAVQIVEPIAGTQQCGLCRKIVVRTATMPASRPPAL